MPEAINGIPILKTLKTRQARSLSPNGQPSGYRQKPRKRDCEPPLPACLSRLDSLSPMLEHRAAAVAGHIGDVSLQAHTSVGTRNLRVHHCDCELPSNYDQMF